MSKKFTEKDIGEFMNRFYRQYKSDSVKDFFFDFSNYDWISNQNLLLITSLIRYLYKCHEKFKIKLFKTDPRQITRNQARTIVQLWEVWKLYKVFDRKEDQFENYIDGFENSTIPYLKGKYSISIENSIYERLGITPFVTLNVISDYKNENILETEIEPIFKLNDVIQSELESEKSEHPFVEETISAIITRELFENFLDHYQTSFFNTSEDMSFMSISLKRKPGRDKYFLKKDFIDKFLQQIGYKYPEFAKFINNRTEKTESKIVQFSYQEIEERISENYLTPNEEKDIIEKFRKEDFKNKQDILRNNAKNEELSECLDFFVNEKNVYRNEAFIHYSFIDYGEGIPTTILPEFLKENGISELTIFNQPNHNDLLKFAFKHYTSRFPILDKLGKTDKYIPRGLFDILTIAKRYNGLLIVRSNYGKLFFNFRHNSEFEEAMEPFGDANHFFPGTYFTLYIPELESQKEFDQSVIRYDIQVPKQRIKPKNINLFSLLGSEFIPKEQLYADLLNKLRVELYNKTGYARLNYISFFGIKDLRVIAKTLYFLLTDYDINKNNSVIIVHPPEKIIIDNINDEIISLSRIIRNYKIHPLPLIYYVPEKDDIKLEWIGVYNNEDKKQLNDLLFEDFSLALSDFVDLHNIKGNVIYSDKYGNINSNLPNQSVLSKYYQLHTVNLLKEAISNFNSLKSDGLYLCNGNYYQYQFLQLSELLDNRIYRDVIATALFQQIIYRFKTKLEIDEKIILNYLFKDRKSTRLNSSHIPLSRMPSSA